MIKKYGTYLAVLAIGLVLGYFIFGNSGSKAEQYTHEVTDENRAMWTCSMHPQIMLPEKGDCPLCGMDLISSETGSGSALMTNQFKMSEKALALSNIETITVGMGESQNNKLTLSGKITANEKTNGIQTTVFDGRIEKLNVNYVGQYVKKGQQLGYIYSPDLYLAQDKLLTSASYKDSHQKLYDAARNTLGLWKMTDEQIDEVLRTKKPMMKFPIYADVSGTVTEVFATEGKWYKVGDPLYKVSNLYTVWAVFDVYENQLSALKQGQDITIVSNAFGDELQAKISFIEPVLNDELRTVSVRVTLNNKNQVLKPGMFVQGQVEVTGGEQVLTVPKSAVLWTGKRSLVYTKPNPDLPIFEMAEVTLGSSMGNSYVILSGLSNGDEVVTNGTFTVDAAAQLQGKKSMMSSKMTMDSEEVMMDGHSDVMHFKGDFKNKFTKAIHAYIALKDALVATDANKSVEKAKVLLLQLNEIDETMLEETVQIPLEKIKKNARHISETTEVKLQRQRFKPLSEDMVAIASNFNGLDQPIYVQFCPMADDNKGGSWLSFQDHVRNPYFGDMMLTCGSVTKTIQ
ncbi:efflux RND transporter periplasmic adaptor subunit [uncultured Kriegella sp.]|uniref:efflux RND transporter periplasmic adaptor subunit n=1 Tax=uncultured Kriegella sp. TaxID=1798910 RepID=UPI0030DC123D